MVDPEKGHPDEDEAFDDFVAHHPNGSEAAMEEWAVARHEAFMEAHADYLDGLEDAEVDAYRHKGD